MAGITFPRDQIFRGWRAGEGSRVVGGIGEQNPWSKEDSRIGELRKWIAQHHTSEVQESYFYSVRTVCPLDKAKEKHQISGRRQLLVALLVGIGVSLLVYWATRSYFENAWKVCQAIADKKEYAIAGVEILCKKMPDLDTFYQLGIKLSRPFSFSRYATADEIWNMHRTAGAPWLLKFRDIFCLLFPICTFFGWDCLLRKTEPQGKRDYNLIIDRSKDERVCPSNFDIRKECDPVTQESISIQKLHSPQMIYLPNYVTEAKKFVTALLLAGKKDFTDPVYRRKFTEEERKQILSQIERIFQLRKGQFDLYFENENDSERPLAQDAFCRYMIDQRVFNRRGQFSEEAKRSLQEILGNDETQALNAEIDGFVDQLPNLQQRETLRRVFKLNLLASSGYIDSLRKDDRAYWRISQFERNTGVTLRAPSAK